MARTARALVGAALVAAVGACAPGAAQPGPSRDSVATSPASSPSSSSSIAPPPTSASPPSVGSTTPAPTSRTPTDDPSSVTPRAARPFDVDAALARITAITDFGPRDATSRAYARAAAYVAAELERLGYDVRLQEIPVPAGTSWGVRVGAGTSANVVADPPGFDGTSPHVVIGAHLDTVPQAPGAEDNASGVAVLVELARMLAEQPAALPVRLVVFGAEESRGSGAAWYAFGSRRFVDGLTTAERKAVVGMVSLDRVGVRAASVPVCFGGRGTRSLADALRAASRNVPTTACRNRASDHVSFEAVGIPAARVGSVPYAAYHSARDVPSVIDRRQLGRTGSVVWSWLRSLD